MKVIKRELDKADWRFKYAAEVALKWEGKVDWRLLHLVSLGPVLRQLTAEDLGICITDTEKFLIGLPGNKLDIKIEPGDIIPHGLPVQLAMNESRRVLKEVGKEVYGIPYIAIAVPIYGDNGHVIGGIAVQQSIEHKEKLITMSREMSDLLSTLSGTIQELAAKGEELSATSQQLASIVETSNEGVKKTDQIVKMVKDISEQSNLLGLNAAIEAARAGTEGRGFIIVAKEVRRLAEHRKKYANDIKSIIGNFAEALDLINASSTELGQVAGQQSSNLSLLVPAMENLSKLSMELIKMAESLAGEK